MILLFFSFFNFFVAAAPNLNELTPRVDPSTSPLDGNSCSRRLMFSIVWGCLSTIFLCAWVSVHPNIPRPRRLEGIYRRLQLLFWMLVAPELVLVLSMRQWVAAGRIAKIYNDTRLKESKRKLPTWTRAHGHFIIMGGLTLITAPSEESEKEPEYSNTNGQVMSYQRFLHLVNDVAFEFPILTEDDINDRTRGDILSKSIAVLQMTWFVVQCIVRAAQHLAVTELELTTLGLCTWHKPLDAKTQIRVYLKGGQSLVGGDNVLEGFDYNTGIWGQRARRGLLNLTKDIVAPILAIFQFDKESSIGSILINFFITLPTNLLLLLFVVLVTPSVLLFSGIMSMILTTKVPPGASHVPPSYTPSTGDIIPGAVFAVLGAIFGGIHLIGWNFTFPTIIEQTLWRVSALLITFIPAYTFFVEHLARYSWGIQPDSPEWESEDIPLQGFGDKFVFFLGLIATFLLVLYVFARLSLLAQSFVLLRRQPASAFCSVNWIEFFPHLS